MLRYKDQLICDRFSTATDFRRMFSRQILRRYHLLSAPIASLVIPVCLRAGIHSLDSNFEIQKGINQNLWIPAQWHTGMTVGNGPRGSRSVSSCGAGLGRLAAGPSAGEFTRNALAENSRPLPVGEYACFASRRICRKTHPAVIEKSFLSSSPNAPIGSGVFRFLLWLAF